MSSDPDLTLETDRLEQLLETPAPSQPVVVVQYRNRGVPSWLLFPLLFLIPSGAMFIYDRVVVERYRVQAVQARQALEGWLANDPRGQPARRDDHSPTTLAPGSSPSTTIAGATSVSLTPASAPTSAPGAEKSAASVPDGPKSGTLPTSPPAPAQALPAELATATPRAPAGPAESSPRTTEPAAGQARANDPQVGGVIAAEVTAKDPPAVAGKAAGMRMRSILPNPFADGVKPPNPPTPGTQNGDLARGAEPIGPQPLKPLPTKEESLREIEDEATKKQAAIAAQLDGKQSDLRSQRIDEQLKFREELREVLRSYGKKAGPEIDNLAKRYGYESDPERYNKACTVWRFARKSQTWKVRMIRSLEMPETVILNLISDDLHNQVGTRNGPRDENEVRVRAAKQLLRHPEPGAAQRPGDSPGAGTAPARSQPLPPHDAVPHSR